MFTDADFTLNLAPRSDESKLILIPVSEDYGVIAVAKSIDNGKVACILFAPAVVLGETFDGFVPQYLRKVITSDFALRSGKWPSIALSNKNAEILSETVEPLMNDMLHLADDQVQVIDTKHKPNITSAAEVASVAYRADEHTPFEKAVVHLLDLRPAKTKKAA